MLSDRASIADTINRLHPDLFITENGNIRLTVQVNGATLEGKAISFETAALMLKSRYERHTEEWAKSARNAPGMQNTGGGIAPFFSEKEYKETAETRDSTTIVAYIAHPVRGENEEEKAENLALIAEIFRHISLSEAHVIPFVPYYIACQALHEDVSAERNIGLKGNAELLSRDFVDEIRLYGDHISKGMSHEILIAMIRGIHVRPMTPETMREFQNTFSKVKPAGEIV